LGAIGGFAALIWGLMGFFINGYSVFEKNRSLLNKFYATDVGVGNGNQITPYDHIEADGGDDLKEEIVYEMDGRKSYNYSYCSYLCGGLAVKFACCCCGASNCAKRRSERIDFHEKATDRMSDEIDIVKLV
jgi:hypothetical protein